MAQDYRNIYCSVLEVRSLKLRYGQVWFFLRVVRENLYQNSLLAFSALILWLITGVLSVSSHHLPFMCVSVQISPFDKSIAILEERPP